MNSILISIIVPVYNTEKYLCRCVDSILAQTFSNFELLLVDDGSTDASGTICDEYAALDPRVRAFHKTNGGVSSARNLGLNNSIGEWIAFVDADDWVDHDYLACLSQSCNGYDLIIGDFILENCIDNWTNDHILSGEYNENSIVELFNNIPYSALLTAPWAKLYKKPIIDKAFLRFDPIIKVGEDTIFNYSYFKYVKKMQCNDSAIYHYVISNMSLSSQAHNGDAVISLSKSLYNIAIYLHTKHNVNPHSFLLKLSYGYIIPYIFNNIHTMSYNQLKTHFAKLLQNECIRMILDELCNKAKNKRERVFSWIYRHNQWLILKYWAILLNKTGRYII